MTIGILDSLLDTDCSGRLAETDVIIRPLLRLKLTELNPGLPHSALDEAYEQLCQTRLDKTELAANRETYGLTMWRRLPPKTTSSSTSTMPSATSQSALRTMPRERIPPTFEDLVDFVNKMREEEARAAREGLNEEELELF